MPTRGYSHTQGDEPHFERPRLPTLVTPIFSQSHTPKSAQTKIDAIAPLLRYLQTRCLIRRLNGDRGTLGVGKSETDQNNVNTKIRRAGLSVDVWRATPISHPISCTPSGSSRSTHPSIPITDLTHSSFSDETVTHGWRDRKKQKRSKPRNTEKRQ